MSGLLFGTIAFAAIGAIEIENAMNVRVKMQNHLDTAILQLGRSEDRYVPQGMGTKHLGAAMTGGDLDIPGVETSFVYDHETGAVKGRLKYQQPSYLAGGLIPAMTFELFAEALPKTTGAVEVALVLDTSGSMGWSIEGAHDAAEGQRRIDHLHRATDTLLDVLAANKQIRPRISIIPYATSVDISDLYAAIPQNQRNGSFQGVDNWSLQALGINTMRRNDVRYQDRSDGRGVWAAERFRSRIGNGFDLSLDAPGGSNKLPVISQMPLQQWCNWQYIRLYGSRCIDVGFIHHYGSNYIDGLTTQRGVMPLSSDMRSIRDYVKSLEPKGGTAGHLGMIWGLYSLAPDWDSLFAHPEGAPQPFDDEDATKLLVIMTDGDFNSNHAQALGGSEDSYAYFQSACALARDRGVRIYAIGLKVSETAEGQLGACVGTTGRFFPVGSQAQLSQAFEDIGNAAGELRISR